MATLGLKWVVNEGKQMLWFSDRDGLRSYATSGATQSDVYSMFFTQEAWDRFNLSKDDFELLKEIELGAKKRGREKGMIRIKRRKKKQHLLKI